jgi:hypothetical protein
MGDEGQAQAPRNNKYHVFISHAGEQKLGVVDALDRWLKKKHGGAVDVFLDIKKLAPSVHPAMKNMTIAMEKAHVGEQWWWYSVFLLRPK